MTQARSRSTYSPRFSSESGSSSATKCIPIPRNASPAFRSISCKMWRSSAFATRSEHSELIAVDTRATITGQRRPCSGHVVAPRCRARRATTRHAPEPVRPEPARCRRSHPCAGTAALSRCGHAPAAGPRGRPRSIRRGSVHCGSTAAGRSGLLGVAASRNRGSRGRLFPAGSIAAKADLGGTPLAPVWSDDCGAFSLVRLAVAFLRCQRLHHCVSATERVRLAC